MIGADEVQNASPRLSASEANRRFYERNAQHYEASEYCTFGEMPQRQLRDLLALAIEATTSPDRVLDAGGGSGNASRQLVALGLEPLLVDVSPEMAHLWREKAARLGIEARVEVSSLEAFFATDTREWDLIVFSSVLHHLENPTQLLRRAAETLAPGGTIATIFDPIASAPIRSLIRRLDYLAWLLRHSPRSLGSALGRRLGLGSGGRADDNLGAMAERHAVTGLDDRALVRALTADGLEVIRHERSHYARFRAMRALARIARVPTNFSLILRKPAS